ncbi:MAG: T9SS-dependent M36 family metallopeptidase [Candidatus Chryseobacterium colombiense]|nr:T9SS-dependent M36 family metallopeptidase [Chryseobacterium sp.]WEK70030.1 MAG: T9SS-dependent M36 family metallopeptidase [Chryseobacterium sp.]
MKKIILPVLIAVLSAIPSSLFSQDNEKLIKDYISQNKLREYKKSDLANFIVDNVDTSKSLNGSVVKFQQTYNGLPVYNAEGTVLIRDNRIIYYTDTFLKDYSSSAANSVSISKTAALQKISENLQKQKIVNYPILGFLDAEPETGNAAKQRLVYVKDGDVLKLAYQFSLPEPDASNYWDILVDATNGNIISKLDLNLSCNFRNDAFSHDFTDYQSESVGPLNGSQQKFSLLVPDNASYNIFPLQLEAPTFGSRAIVSNPWNLTASPEGWHYDGTTHYTITRGNNVYAYEDTLASNTPGVSPDGGASRNFNFPFNIYGDSVTNQSAAITNLFYMNNKMHDIFYAFGFTPTARNFQNTNFGLGGVGNDYVNAEAQDGGGTNNANFASPADGSKPRMQMYLWSAVNHLFFYNAPTSAQARYPAVGVAAAPAPQLTATGVMGDVKASPVDEGCTALPGGSLTGKIGLVKRGNCNFDVKIKNLQNAGAIAAIIYNQAPNTAINNMSITDATVAIPGVLITNEEGTYITNLLSANTTVNVTLKNDPALSMTPDGDFDNGIISHEYGHGISNRLTGTGSGCLNSSLDKEQMGEGWSDFFALMLTNGPNATAAVPRGIGTYVMGQSNDGDGIRPFKYSPDFAINPATYGNTNGLEYNSNGTMVPDVHSIGFIWATMLWDLHWQYVAKYGYSSDVMTNTTNGSSRVLQLITDALKLQVCNPTFIDGRDAVLAADLATTGGADKCMIWRTFAKRGLGVSASAGSKTNINDQIEDFTVPAECVLATDEVKSVKANTISIYPNPAKNEFFINFPSNTLGKVSVEIYDMSGKLVSSEDKVSPEDKKSISTERLTTGTYIVKVKGIGIDTASKVIVKK